MSDEPFHSRLIRQSWRLPVIAVTTVMAVFAWEEPVVAVFGALPIVIWCLLPARSARNGLITSLVLLVPVTVVLLPRALGWQDRWVPSVFEVYLFLPILTALIWAMATRGERSCLRAVGFTAFVVVGFIGAAISAIGYAEGGIARDEQGFPIPTDLRVVSDTSGCGSRCLHTVTVAGDRAADRIRDHLRSRGYTDSGRFDTEMCRVTGLILPYKVCKAVSETSPTEAIVEW
ncbi:hypothetical protein DMH04_51600 [Kibdelosporangium aridum]|uniref:Uncharacterized protein n=1 Tax=Kibdelosporangium aridum TaxID=2030 RepID=A0A428Y9J8_KIBAR|nr:hypothetical protein [Kibdelosporangium aridum]RSM64191.1 hypothetical protein DMH04_51600 [Kibdelosporangium aridum]